MAPPSPRPRVAVLSNPAAGRGRVARHLGAVLDRFTAAGLTPEPVAATARDAAVAECRAAVASGVDAVVAVGGDGTAHLAVQALAGTAVPLGLVPLGTGNDLASAFGVPIDPGAAADALADDLRAGTSVAVDAARTTGPDGAAHGWWVAILSAGFDALVNERANRMRWPRGPRRYDVAILAELVRLAPRTLTLDLDGERWTGPVTLVAVGNTSRYGGGMRMCPAADPTDGLLDVTVVGPVGRVELVRVKPRLYTGTHVEHPKVTTYRARRVAISAADGPGGASTYADGERLAPLPLTATCEPGALRLVGARPG